MERKLSRSLNGVKVMAEIDDDAQSRAQEAELFTQALEEFVTSLIDYEYVLREQEEIPNSQKLVDATNECQVTRRAFVEALLKV